MNLKQKITPFLWFDGNAEEAVGFYTGIFDGSSITGSMPGPDGKPMTITFELAGQQFIALNGGPAHKFNEAFSLFVGCDTQQEIDRLWGVLTAEGGSPLQCGWLKDRFGLCWQIVPNEIAPLLSGENRDAAARVMQALWQMTKLDIAELRRARDNT